jgi:hypothetical protein
MKEWIKKRNIFDHENLVEELEIGKPVDYTNFCACVSTYNDLLEIVTHLRKEDSIVKIPSLLCRLLQLYAFLLLVKR